MKRYAIILILLTLLAVAVRAQAPKRYSVESAIRFIDMARAAEQGKMPAEADWQSLFQHRAIMPFQYTHRLERVAGQHTQGFHSGVRPCP